MMYNCKSCKISFKSMSLLRKHQWASHSERFESLRKAATSRKAIRKRRETIARNKLVRVNNGASPMTAVELLEKLTEQKNLLDSTVALLKGIMEH